MKHNVLATDYDGTLAKDGFVESSTVDALLRWRRSNGVLILVTGRRLEPLLEIFPQIDIFHLIVAENGALLYHPTTKKVQPLADPPPGSLIKALRIRNVPLEIGRVIVATRTPHETAALQVIRDLGLEWTITFNKGAVMLLPSGINKASGLEAGLRELNLSARKTIGIGDAENDEAFLKLCGLSIAVGNALPAVKEQADVVTQAERGAGVVEWIDGNLSR